MRADPSDQLRLLDVQELDSRADTLRHRIGSVPEAQQLKELGTQRTHLSNQVRDLRIEVADLTREQKQADRDVEQVKTRRVRDQGMIDAGQVKDPKALERMLGELQSLERRIGDLEDVELEVMERLEAAETALAEREAQLASLEAHGEDLRATVMTTTSDLDVQLADVVRQRAAAVEGLPEDLVKLYEKLRANKGGVGAAPLRRRECGGCRLTLNASDLGVIAKTPADTVVRCEECDRILVRTPESGLAQPGSGDTDR